MTLHEKGIPFETREEDLKHLSSAVKELHPQAKVPVLVHENRAIYESSIITEYIEERFPTPIALMPQNAGDRAEVRLWTYWCNTLLKPDIDRLKYGAARFPESECLGVEARLMGHLERLEQKLRGGEWLVGTSISLADIHVFPFCRQLVRVTPTPEFLGHSPLLLQWIERVSLRPSFLCSMEKA